MKCSASDTSIRILQAVHNLSAVTLDSLSVYINYTTKSKERNISRISLRIVLAECYLPNVIIFVGQELS